MTDLNYIISRFKEAEKIGELGKGSEDPRSDVSNSADKELRKTAYDFGVSQGWITNPATNADNLNEELVSNYVGFVSQVAQKDAFNRFSNKLEDIVDNQISKDKLEKIIRYEAVVNAAEGKDQEAIGKYLGYQKLKDFAGSYKGPESIKSEQEANWFKIAQENAVNLALEDFSKEAEKKEKERQKLAGYKDSKLVKLAGKLSSASAQSGAYDIKSEGYIVDGINEQAEEVKKAYEKVGVDIYDAVRNTLKKMGKGSAEDFGAAFSAVYQACK